MPCLQLEGPDDESERGSSATELAIQGYEPTAQQLGKGYVLGVVRLCPAEGVRQLPGCGAKSRVVPNAERRVFKHAEALSGLPRADLSTPLSFVQDRAGLGPQ